MKLIEPLLEFTRGLLKNKQIILLQIIQSLELLSQN